jgi:hypothetical protein
MILVRDIQGNPLFYLEGDVARDSSGKPVAVAVDKDGESRRLTKHAARVMTATSPESVLMDLAPGDVVTPSTQDVYAMPFGDFVADQVSQVRYVKNDRGVYYAENVADATSLVMAVAAADGTPSEINPGFGSGSFKTTGYALATRLSRSLVNNADFDLKAIALHRLIIALRLGREYRLAQLLTTAANWATKNQITATAKWNGGITANPLADLFAALAASALPASMVVMPELAAQYFFQNANSTAMRDYVQSGGEMPKVVFARAKFTSAGNAAYIWAPTLPANVAMVRSTDHLPTTTTYRWLGDDKCKDGERAEGMLVRQFWSNTDDSYWIIAAHNDAELMIAPTVGAIITGAMA